MSEYSGKNEPSAQNEKGENPKERLGKLKPDLSLIPQSALVLEAMAMMQGARKYGPYNWRQTKVQARTYVAATMRHLAAWLDGEEVAEDSEIHHLAHARASLGVVMDAQVCGMMVDDRVKGVAGGLIEAYATRNDPEESSKRVTGHVVHGIPIENGTYVNMDDGTTLFVPAANPPAATYPGGRTTYSPPAGVSLPRQIPDGAGGFTYLHGTDTEPGGTAFYVAGPMRGIPGFNFPAFDRARDVGRNLGYTIISPADMDRRVGVDENTDLDEEGIDVRTFVERDVSALLSLSPENGSGIALLPDWEHSTGALAELFVARWLGLRVVDATTFREFVDGSPADRIARLVSTINDPPEDMG